MDAENDKKWRRDVGLNSAFSGARPVVPALLAAAPAAAAAAALSVYLPAELRPLVLRSAAVAAVAYAATRRLLPVIGAKVPRAKYGCDLLKRPAREAIADADKTVPESLGLVSGVCFVLALVVTEAFDARYLDASEYSAAEWNVHRARRSCALLRASRGRHQQSNAAKISSNGARTAEIGSPPQVLGCDAGHRARDSVRVRGRHFGFGVEVRGPCGLLLERARSRGAGSPGAPPTPRRSSKTVRRRRRYKYVLPPLMALPLLSAYETRAGISPVGPSFALALEEHESQQSNAARMISKTVFVSFETSGGRSRYDGGTTVAPPRAFRSLLVDGGGTKTALGDIVHAVLSRLGGGVLEAGAGLVDLGRAYQIYMVLLAVFCTNAINIYAGATRPSGTLPLREDDDASASGVPWCGRRGRGPRPSPPRGGYSSRGRRQQGRIESSLSELGRPQVNGLEAGQAYVVACAIIVMSAIELGANNADSTPNHLFAVTVMLPFASTTLALLRSNWYPATVFVGDTFTNYAGMALAVVAILGHFPLMLLLLMLPQLLNFLISVPQLFKLAPCPRHRLPTYDEATGLLRASRLNDRARTVAPERDQMNLTLINVVLRASGGLTEPALAAALLGLQAAACGAGLALRFALAGRVY